MSEIVNLSAAVEHNIHSQMGEDGVIAAICRALDISNGTAVEFGAWDGVHLSNSRGAARSRLGDDVYSKATQTVSLRSRRNLLAVAVQSQFRRGSNRRVTARSIHC